MSDGSHGLQGQCVASAKHRSDSGVADSATRRGTPKIKKISHHTFSVSAESGIKECNFATRIQPPAEK
ncbi:MAG: hypothetical protein NZ529_02285 [Cytophagaceae bacterium]|nr:hypothetical protein [Cytophagaceae bacterium]MDW8455597.1 hypothetical protein [Cytophagaceae bacterium]